MKESFQAYLWDIWSPENLGRWRRQLFFCLRADLKFELKRESLAHREASGGRV